MEKSSNDSSMNTENPISEPDPDLLLTSPRNSSDAHEDRCESKTSFNQNEILRALEVVERDSMAIAESFTSLFSSLRLALSEVSCFVSSIENYDLGELITILVEFLVWFPTFIVELRLNNL